MKFGVLKQYLASLVGNYSAGMVTLGLGGIALQTGSDVAILGASVSFVVIGVLLAFLYIAIGISQGDGHE